MKSLTKLRFDRVRVVKQRGVVLFFALIALLAMSLAAVALIRSVDTSTMIAGNLAFKQAATTSGDAGIEAAITWLTATDTAATTARAGTANTVLNDLTHPFNVTNAANGYYSNADSALNLFADATWNAITIPAVTDNSGNSKRYIIQRMCRTANALVTAQNCLFSGAIQDTNGQNIPLPQDVCTGAGCPAAGQTPQMRITTRVDGPKNTVSYVQAFVY
ncbi:MAG: pilus assembly PilX N-terminal domain-containing protein [Gallionella sp.]|nr:pilus assembly PilX N-terminal domain-containing protein [Gallionella sp.]